MVAQINKMESSELESFLFGSARVSLEKARNPIWELQERRCFYCGDRIAKASSGEVDHFVPRARYPDDGLHNLVVAHRKCNNNKRDILASSGHVENWAARNGTACGVHADLTAIAGEIGMEADREKTLGVARGIYLSLPVGAMLWEGCDSMVAADPGRLRVALG